MAFDFKRNWDGDAWETFALRLVQLRHGAENVQHIPDTVKGDAGIEFLTTDGCCYQCYAPQEVFETKKAASGMKAKISRDLKKLIVNSVVISKLLGNIKIKRWILLCPFLDDKTVVSHLKSKCNDIIDANLSFIDTEFQGLVHSAVNFEKEILTLRSSSQGVPIDIIPPSDEAVHDQTNALSDRLEQKLERGFPHDSPERRVMRKKAFVTDHLISENLMGQLRSDHPSLWERSRQTIQSEERRLASAGPGPGLPEAQIHRGLERLELRLTSELPALPGSVITSIATGTVGTWLIECPLDFSEISGS